MSKIKRILYNDISNGPGFRTSVFLSGCSGVIWNKKTKKYDHCLGCFNSEAWSFNIGQETTFVMNDILKSLSFQHIQGLSILGGEPLCKENQQDVAKIIESVRNCYGQNKNIWVWTGYIYTKNPFNKNRIPKTKWTKYIIKNVDVLVDGPFIKEKFDLNLQYKGSSNQRILKLD